MTFDAKSLLTAPLVDLTVDGLAAALKHLQDMGLGSANIKMPDETPLGSLELVARGIEPAHFVLRRKGPTP
jgi:hypothetical protein